MWTAAHQKVLEDFDDKFGLPGLDGESARAWTMKLAEQFTYSFPDENWGTKRASSTRPYSTDVICTEHPFVGYDVIANQGVPNQKLNNLIGNRGEHLDGQIFISVHPINHLGSSSSGNTTDPVKPPVIIDRIVYVTKPLPDPGELTREMHHLHDFYRHELKREQGLWIFDQPDFEGISAWILGVYIPKRMEGKSLDEARQAYENMIRDSHEWREKNR